MKENKDKLYPFSTSYTTTVNSSWITHSYKMNSFPSISIGPTCDCEYCKGNRETFKEPPKKKKRRIG